MRPGDTWRRVSPNHLSTAPVPRHPRKSGDPAFSFQRCAGNAAGPFAGYPSSRTCCGTHCAAHPEQAGNNYARGTPSCDPAAKLRWRPGSPRRRRNGSRNKFGMTMNRMMRTGGFRHPKLTICPRPADMGGKRALPASVNFSATRKSAAGFRRLPVPVRLSPRTRNSSF